MVSAMDPRGPFRRLRHLAVQLMALLAFVGALATSGSAYAFCPHAKRVMQSKPRCCGGQHAKKAAEDRPATWIERKSCCEVRNIDVLPAADTPALPILPAATVREGVFELAPGRAPHVWLRTAPTPPRQAVPIRAGPQTAHERCIRLQTFLR
jgi:hypothetical protein